MPLEVVEAHTHLQLRYKAPVRTRPIAVHVEATGRVDVLAVPREGLDEFENGYARVTIYEKSANKKNHDLLVRPDSNAVWYLLVVNQQDEEVSVYYEVEW